MKRNIELCIVSHSIFQDVSLLPKRGFVLLSVLLMLPPLRLEKKKDLSYMDIVIITIKYTNPTNLLQQLKLANQGDIHMS